MSQSQPLPDTSDDHCAVCHQTAPYLKRNRTTDDVVRYCRLHAPVDFGLAPSLTRLLEEAYL